MMSDIHWLSIVGIGEDGFDGLSHEAKQLIASAEILYGGARHLGLVPDCAASAIRVCWPSPMASAVQHILEELRGRSRVAVLASGDPMLYGVGASLTRNLPNHEFRVVPQVSAFSLACARMGWPIADISLVSLVNRTEEYVLRYLCPGQRLVIFSEDEFTPAKIARLLTKVGFGLSRMSVLENLGGSSERHTTNIACEWQDASCGRLNVIAVCCIADATTHSLSTAAGLPDEAFDTDSQITKREVRAVTLARLAPLPRQMLWDVGAGSGSVGIEWMRLESSCSCIAFELREDRAVRIQQNAARLGVPNLKVIQGAAPETFARLHSPDAIFIGGGVSNDALFDACWGKLLSGGRLVANAVTLSSEASLIARHAIYGGDLMRMMVARADPIGNHQGWRPMMPITQWVATKP